MTRSRRTSSIGAVITMREELREKLLVTGIELFRAQGYHATGIQQIVDRAGIPKGSFCFYFGSKEGFALQVIERYAAGIDEHIRRYFEQRDEAPLARLEAFFRDTISAIENEGSGGGCTIGNLLAEIDATNDALHGALRQAWRRLEGAFELFLAAAVEADELAAGTDVEALAGFLLGSWEGALISVRAQGSVEPLRRFLAMAYEPLKSA